MLKVRFRFSIDGENEKGLITVFVNKQQYLNNDHETKALELINEKYFYHPAFDENSLTIDEYDIEVV